MRGADTTIKNAYGFIPWEGIRAKREYFSLE